MLVFLFTTKALIAGCDLDRLTSWNGDAGWSLPSDLVDLSVDRIKLLSAKGSQPAS